VPYIFEVQDELDTNYTDELYFITPTDFDGTKDSGGYAVSVATHEQVLDDIYRMVGVLVHVPR
jgi:hypothetical protein